MMNVIFMKNLYKKTIIKIKTPKLKEITNFFIKSTNIFDDI